MRARDVMFRAVATTTPETTVEKVAGLMINLRISGVPVLDRNGQLVGIVTEGDLLRLETRHIKRVPVVHDGKIVGIVSRADLLQVLASGGGTTAAENSDRLIHERLLAELRTQEWANPAEANVVVSDGVVHFWGTVGSEEERTALRVIAENIPGVRGIEDHAISGPRYLTPLYPGI